MGKRLGAILLAAAVCLAMSGCSAFPLFDAKNLMAPPKVNEDQQAIYQLLRNGRQEVTYVYPTTGEFRSAIIMHDFTGDGQADAVGFTNVEDGGTEVRFLTKSSGEWRLLAVFRNQANQVDRVCFGKLTSRTRDDVIIGWGVSSGATGRTASVTAYLYDGAFGFSEAPMGLYAEMVLADLDGNGLQEVFTVDKAVPAETEADSPTPATARLYAWDGTTMGEKADTPADSNITSYSQTLFGRLGADLNGVVLDGVRADGSLTTQVFCLENGFLTNYPQGVNTEEYATAFQRPSSAPFLSRDIDGDGTLEIPRTSLLPCLPEDAVPDSTSYLVEWTAFRKPGVGQLVARCLMNQAENYWFRLPYKLRDRITAVNDTAAHTVTYREVLPQGENGDGPSLGGEIFSIRVFTRAAWDREAEQAGYELLTTQGDVFYGIRGGSRASDWVSFRQTVKSSFSLLME